MHSKNTSLTSKLFIFIILCFLLGLVDCEKMEEVTNKFTQNSTTEVSTAISEKVDIANVPAEDIKKERIKRQQLMMKLHDVIKNKDSWCYYIDSYNNFYSELGLENAFFIDAKFDEDGNLWLDGGMNTDGRDKGIEIIDKYTSSKNIYYYWNRPFAPTYPDLKPMITKNGQAISEVEYDKILNKFKDMSDSNIAMNTDTIFDEIFKNINIEPYNEIDWMTSEPTGGLIVFKECKQKDIDGDGIDELFVLRQYVNPNDRSIIIDKTSSLENFYKYAIRQGFISESYKIIQSKAKEITIDNEPISTQAFAGGHFGIYFFLLADGRIAKFDSSYWEENLTIYDKLKLDTTLSFIGDMSTGEWHWEINKKKVSETEAIEFIKKINVY